MARSRVWDNLRPSTQARYERWATKNNIPDARAYYQAGGSLTAARGHAQTGGLSEYRMRKLTREAKGVEFSRKGDPATAGQVIRAALASGLSYDQILAAIKQRKTNAGLTPKQRMQAGQARWATRPTVTDERASRLYWYH